MKLKILLPGLVGNFAEWYEYALYGFCVPIISKLFFPHKEGQVAVFAVYAIFAAGFLLRPLGGLFFGYYGDKKGRSKMLSISVVVIGIPTFLMGILPTYHSIGAFAILAIILIRLLQGISIGGEFSGSLIYLSEESKLKNRGLLTGVVLCSAFLGMLIASLSLGLLSRHLTTAEYHSYGWRLPFLFGIVIAWGGFFMRRHMPDTRAFKRIERKNQLSVNPIAESFSYELPGLLKVFVLSWLSSLVIYILFIYLPQYSIHYLNLTSAAALINNAYGMVMLGLSCLLFGKLSDRFGRKPILFIATLMILVFCYPTFSFIMNYPHLMKWGDVFFGFIAGAYLGPCFAIFPELFPTKIRYTSVALAYNIGFALFAGTAPLISSYFVSLTGNLSFPAYYISAVALGTLFVVPLLKETSKIDLNDLSLLEGGADQPFDIAKIRSGYNIELIMKLFSFVFLPAIVFINIVFDFILTGENTRSGFMLQNTLYVFLASLIIATLMTLLMFYFLYKKRADQAKLFFLDMMDVINRDTGNDKSLIDALAEHYHDESIGVIADVFAKNMRFYKNREKMRYELSIAKKIQQDMLPQNFDKIAKNHPDLHIDARLVSARTIGGDMYDCFFLDEHVLLFAIGDGCGKGIPGCLLTSRVLDLLRLEAKLNYPAESLSVFCEKVLSHLNRALCNNNNNSRFVTMVFGVVDTQNKKIVLSNAGHNFPYLVSKNELKILAPSKTSRPLGLNPASVYPAISADLTDNTKLFLYTDGITEAKNKRGYLFGDVRLETALLGRSMLSAKSLLDVILHDVSHFSRNVEQADDITALCVEWCSEAASSGAAISNEKFDYTFTQSISKAQIKEFKNFVQVSLERKVSQETLHDLLLCVEEYLINLIKYAKLKESEASEVTLSIALKKGRVILRIKDSLLAFDPVHIDADALSKHFKVIGQRGGQGLMLLHKLLDSIEYYHTDTYNECIMTKHCSEVNNEAK